VVYHGSVVKIWKTKPPLFLVIIHSDLFEDISSRAFIFIACTGYNERNRYLIYKKCQTKDNLLLMFPS